MNASELTDENRALLKRWYAPRREGSAAVASRPRHPPPIGPNEPFLVVMLSDPEDRDDDYHTGLILELAARGELGLVTEESARKAGALAGASRVVDARSSVSAQHGPQLELVLEETSDDVRGTRTLAVPVAARKLNADTTWCAPEELELDVSKTSPPTVEDLAEIVFGTCFELRTLDPDEIADHQENAGREAARIRAEETLLGRTGALKARIARYAEHELAPGRRRGLDVRIRIDAGGRVAVQLNEDRRRR